MFWKGKGGHGEPVQAKHVGTFDGSMSLGDGIYVNTFQFQASF